MQLNNTKSLFSPALKVDDQSHSKASQMLTQTYNAPEMLLPVMQLQFPSTVFEFGMAKISFLFITIVYLFVHVLHSQCLQL